MTITSGSLTDKTVLILDDAPDIRLLVKKILQGDGATIIEADTVELALKNFREFAPHLILLDLEMPGKNGFDFLRMRTEDAALKQVPTIALSGLRDRSSISKAISLEASDYLLKPFRATLLLQKVRRALKVSSFLSRKFPADALPQVECAVEAEIVRVSDIGCEIETVVRLSPDKKIVLDSNLLKSLGVAEAVMKTLPSLTSYQAPGRYRSEVNFIGIDEDLARNIRIAIGNWK